MSKELATRALFADALAGRIDRRTLLRAPPPSASAPPVAAALAQETVRGALASEEGKPNSTFYDWMPRTIP